MKSKRFSSVPGAAFAPCIFLCGIISYLLGIYKIITEQFSILALFICVGMTLLCSFALVTSFPRMMCTIELQEHQIICKAPFQKTIIIDYRQSYVGMDYHLQNGRKVWWIYLSEGVKLPYQANNSKIQINSIKCKPGFIRIMYRDEVYNALLEVLPPKQRTALLSAYKNSGFAKKADI